MIARSIVYLPATAVAVVLPAFRDRVRDGSARTLFVGIVQAGVRLPWCMPSNDNETTA